MTSPDALNSAADMTMAAGPVIVTGAAGFIGRYVVARLLDHVPANRLVLMVRDAEPANNGDRFADDVIERWVGAGARVIRCDLVSGRSLDEVPADPSVVIHLATDSDTGSSDHRVNDVGTANLLEALGGLSRGARFVFTSSIAVSEHRSADVGPAGPNVAFRRPRSEYGRTKLKAEALLTDRALEAGYGLLIARLGVIFGDGCRPGGFVDVLRTAPESKRRALRLNFPGRVSMAYVNDIATFLVREALAGHGWDHQAVRLMYPSTETVVVGSALRRARSATPSSGTRPAPIDVPTPVWNALYRVLRVAGRAEALIPLSIYNRLWQLEMMVGRGFETTLEARDEVSYGATLSTFQGWLERSIPDVTADTL